MYGVPNQRHSPLSLFRLQFQDRMAEVLQSLSNLVKDVESTSMPSVCGSSLLKMLAHNARNYLRALPSVSVMVEQFLPGSPQTYSRKKIHLCWHWLTEPEGYFTKTELQNIKDEAIRHEVTYYCHNILAGHISLTPSQDPGEWLDQSVVITLGYTSSPC